MPQFVAAHEAYHDAHDLTPVAVLERAVRLESDSLYGLRVQVRRIRATEPEDEQQTPLDAVRV